MGVRVYAAVEQRNEILRDEMLRLCLRGHKIAGALAKIGRGRVWYLQQRKAFPKWAMEVSLAGGKVWGSAMAEEARRLGFERTPEQLRQVKFDYFCERYLHQRLFRHQLQWWDMLEGREPRDLHPSMTYERREPNYMLINTPPNHVPS